MSELIAKRYIKALKSEMDNEALTNLSEIFSVLALSFKDEKFNNIISNPKN